MKMVQGSTTTYAYGSFNRLSSAGSTTYTYDANGNMLTKNDGFSWAFTYDYDNRLTKVVRAGSTVLQNAYDGDGKRIKKTEGNPIVSTYQGLNVLYEKDLTTGVVTKRFYANGLQVAKMVGSTISYLHEDHIGSIRFVSSSTGSQVFSSNYVPYGPQYGASGTPDEFLYAGKIYDGSTGFYYFSARYYDPTIGRFVTQDSVSGAGDDPQSLNRYVYARDNPMKITDPNGHDWWGSLTSAISNAASPISSAISTATSAVTNALSSVPPLVQSVGNQVVSTLSSIATSVANALTDAGQRAANRIAQGAQTISQALTYVATSPILDRNGPSGAVGVAGTGAVLTYLATRVAIQTTPIAISVAGSETLLAATGKISWTAAVPQIGKIAGPLYVAAVFGFATGYTIGYLTDSRQTPTKEGALNAFGEGLKIATGLKEILS